ncbi:ATP12 family chaperone protein [Tropicimonas sp. S265A]|uniref:ATP12 family chaperone protein n=1 Tax=Tropicimonas sp. S265A TaxID=3415134 RepID=UPI003C7B7904
MSGWASKRFWQTTSVDIAEGGYAVALDGRPVRTPLKKPLVVPTAEFANAIAAEWDAQEDTVDPTTMPFTRAANAALDKVSAQREEVRQILADYAGTDLLCYRATGPETLVARQAAAWDAHLDWAAQRYGAPLTVTSGIVPVAQPKGSLDAYRAEVAWFSDFELTGFHDLVAISGSLILAFAVAEGRISAAEGYDTSRIDELWQIEQWGEDEEASALAEHKRSEFLRAFRVMQMSKPEI